MSCMELPDLRRLHVLRMVDQYGTVTAAAEALHLTPSAVSHQVRQLSRELDAALLEPDGRRVRLTAAGHTLVAHADALHAGWERVRTDLAAHADGSAGTLRICAFPTALAGLVAPAARQLRTTYPRTSLHVAEVETADGFGLLLAGDADIAVVVPTPESPSSGDPKFDQQPLLEEPQDLLVAADHPFAGQGAVTLADAAEEPWIVDVPGSRSECYQLLLVACAAAGFTPDVAHYAREWVAVSALVACGFGVALIPRLAPVPPQYPAVRIPLTGNPRPSRRILTCVRRGSADHPAIARGLEALRNVAAGAGEAAGGARLRLR